MRYMTGLLVLLCFALPATAGPRVLFVGNSYTFANSDYLAKGFAEIVQADLGDDAEVATVAKGGYTLSGHLADASVPGQAIHDLLVAEGSQWDVVVFQEQSVIPAYHDSVAQEWYNSLAAAKELAALAVAAGATPVFLMTWGRREGLAQDPETLPDYLTMQGLLEGGYQKFVDYAGNGAILIPAGLAWKAIYDDAVAKGEDPLAQEHLFWRLYTGDGSHPSLEGSALAALVSAATLVDVAPVESSWAPEGIAVDDLVSLRLAAHVARFGAPPTPPVEPPLEHVEVVEAVADEPNMPDVVAAEVVADSYEVRQELPEVVDPDTGTLAEVNPPADVVVATPDSAAGGNGGCQVGGCGSHTAGLLGLALVLLLAVPLLRRTRGVIDPR